MKLRECSSGERKIDSYYGVYDFHFGSVREKEFKILEIGIQHGGSLRLWEKYFPNSSITGVDIDPHCVQYKSERTNVVIGDQANREFLRTLGDFDIVIDDGGHTMEQQFISFDELFGLLPSGGVYVIEDVHTSYWKDFLDFPQTTIDFFKGQVDAVNEFGISNERNANRRNNVNPYKIESIHFHPSMIVIYKK